MEVPAQVAEVVRSQVQGALATLYAQLVQAEAELLAWEQMQPITEGVDQVQREAFGIERSRQIGALKSRTELLKAQIAALQAALE
jgi:BMFP domain-containing protein YqiC